MSNQVAVSIIIPAFNEAEVLGITLEYLRAAQCHFEEQYRLASEIRRVFGAPGRVGRRGVGSGGD